jgi:formate hydrogenlyase subunit 6/NADH:ubiquinone oxidoreductase subunit I
MLQTEEHLKVVSTLAEEWRGGARMLCTHLSADVCDLILLQRVVCDLCAQVCETPAIEELADELGSA